MGVCVVAGIDGAVDVCVVDVDILGVCGVAGSGMLGVCGYGDIGWLWVISMGRCMCAHVGVWYAFNRDRELVLLRKEIFIKKIKKLDIIFTVTKHPHAPQPAESKGQLQQWAELGLHLRVLRLEMRPAHTPHTSVVSHSHAYTQTYVHRGNYT